jgi:hypothetical protein
MESTLNAVIHDLHYPQYHKPSWYALMDFLLQNKVDSVTLGGDQFHYDCIAHHTKGKGLYRLPGAYQNDVTGFDKELLTPLEQVIGETKKVYHIGNHERFEHDLIEEHPELSGIVDHTKILKLEEREWKIVPLGHCSKLGKLTVAHGEILSGFGNGGLYPAKKAVELYGTSVLIGHVHAPQSYTKISPVERSQKHMGWVAPCMCVVNPAYLRNGATAWMNGFSLVEVMSNGLFNLYPIIISSGKFSFAGRVYGK